MTGTLLLDPPPWASRHCRQQGLHKGDKVVQRAHPGSAPDGWCQSRSCRQSSSPLSRRHGPTAVVRCSAVAEPVGDATAAQDSPAEASEASEEGAEPAGGARELDTPSSSPDKHNIVFVTSEVAPYSKTGGLGDVCGALPPALAKRGHRVMVVTPKYGNYEGIKRTDTTINVHGADITFWTKNVHGVDFVFVEHPSYERPGGIYSDMHGVYKDNQWRYGVVLSLAGCEAPLVLPLGGRGTYGEDCIFIANDWHAAMVPIYLAAKYRRHGVYRGGRSVLAIHNLRHQGVFAPATYAMLGLPGEWYGSLEWQYPPHQRQGSYEEEGRAINTLKGAISTADRLVTVSPGYASEIQSYPGGCGLEGILASRSYVLNGILNGISSEEWDPSRDPHIPERYSQEDVQRGKAANKKALQAELGLPQDPHVPLVGFIGRLDYQKGADLILGVSHWLMAQGAQLVCLGTGDPSLEDGLRWMEGAFPQQARGWVGFNVEVSHKITAAVDLLLMPSRFEPCGLNQLYAMAYGTVPVAHATGGLRDTVIPFNPFDGPTGSGTGWTFSPCTVEAFQHALGNALETYKHHQESFRSIQLRGMQRDSSWDRAASQYEQVFSWAKFDNSYV